MCHLTLKDGNETKFNCTGTVLPGKKDLWKWSGCVVVDEFKDSTPSPPPSEFCTEKWRQYCSVIRSAMDALKIKNKITLLTVTVLFLFALFNLILEEQMFWTEQHDWKLFFSPRCRWFCAATRAWSWCPLPSPPPSPPPSQSSALTRNVLKYGVSVPIRRSMFYNKKIR